jgi:hypothetical protein
MAFTHHPDGLNRKQTLLLIARCPIFTSRPTVPSPCRAILAIQRDMPLTRRQVPEPWRGRMDRPLLFVSSNPSLDQLDDSPIQAESDEVLEAYFERGFPLAFPRIQLKDSSVRREYVRFWASLRHRAAEICDVPAKDIRPGINFSITEIVHCKSRAEEGVTQAASTCKQLHWNSMMRTSGAKLVVVIGKVARDCFNLAFPTETPKRDIAFDNRWVITLPAPNARKVRKTVRTYYTQEQLAPIRKELHESRNQDGRPF